MQPNHIACTINFQIVKTSIHAWRYLDMQSDTVKIREIAGSNMSLPMTGTIKNTSSCVSLFWLTSDHCYEI